MTIKTKKRLIALVITIVMAFSLVLPMASASGKLATPELITVGAPLESPFGGIQNPARSTQFRLLLFEEIEGATGYDVYVFRSRADAQTNDASKAIAVSRNQTSTVPSQAGGGTQGTAAIALEEGQVGIDVRLIQYDEIEAGTTRVLPAGYTPAGLGDSYMPGTPGSGDTTNLKPGQYWFTVSAVDVNNPSIASDLCDPHDDAYSIAIGPDEAADIIAPRLDELGVGEYPTLRLIDLRAWPEHGDEGVVRYFGGEYDECTDRLLHHEHFNTVERAEAVFGHVDDKSAVTIFVMCRGGGRTLSASRHLADAGYVNTYNVQGVNQWALGLTYTDAEFRFRPFNDTEFNVDGDQVSPATGQNVGDPAGIGYDAMAGVIRWYNIPRAKFNIYAFTSATETNPANAVAVGHLDDIALDVTGSTRDHRWVRVFNIATLGLNDGTYYIRVQAVPDVEVPIAGTDIIWGEASALSDAVEYVSTGVFPFGDVHANDWFYNSVTGAYRADLMNGVDDHEFAPGSTLTLAQAITMAARIHAGGDENIPKTGGEWYLTYRNYCVTNNIIAYTDFSNFLVDATRAQMAYIFANVFSGEEAETSELRPPDVDANNPYADQINFLYSIGVLRGNDDKGTFAPTSNITRAEAATILLRAYRILGA